MRSMLMGRAAAGLAPILALLFACGARTEPLLTDPRFDGAGLASDGEGRDDAGVADGGNGHSAGGPCYLCRSPLVQECSACLIQGLDGTWVCPIPHDAPGSQCSNLVEDHLTPKGAHFTCFYCL